MSLAGLVNALYRSVQPDPRLNAHSAMRTLFWIIANQIHSLIPQADISQ